MKSKFKCVYWNPDISKWVAKVKVNYKAHHLGVFAREEDAGDAVLTFKKSAGIVRQDGIAPSLSEAFDYRDGRLYARFPASYVKAGDCVGCVCKAHGYVMVGHGGLLHRAHRIVWLMFRGEVSAGMEVDHINGDRSDNRIENLRLVTKAENSRNRKTPTNNTSGEIGIQRRRSGSYQARVGKLHVGTFETIDEAVAARRAASIPLGFHENHGRRAA